MAQSTLNNRTPDFALAALCALLSACGPAAVTGGAEALTTDSQGAAGPLAVMSFHASNRPPVLEWSAPLEAEADYQVDICTDSCSPLVFVLCAGISPCRIYWALDGEALSADFERRFDVIGGLQHFRLEDCDNSVFHPRSDVSFRIRATRPASGAAGAPVQAIPSPAPGPTSCGGQP